MKTFETIIGNSLKDAIHYLSKDELVAIPTETVYGLAANAFSPEAIKKVYRTKQRPFTNPLIVHTDDLNKIKNWVTHIPQAAIALFNHLTPGPLTVLLPKSARMPDEVNNGRREVAFRIPAHPLTLSLLHQLDFPLVAPSANLFGTVSPTQPDHVLKNFNGQIPYILDGGPCDVGIESTVVGFNKNGDPVIYRHGAVTAENIEAIAGAVQARYPDNDTVSPGMLPYHYSPKTPFFLSQMVMPDPFDDINRMGAIRFCQYHPLIPRKNQFILSQAGSLQEAAKNLYKAMHLLDEMGLQKIFAEKLPDTGLGKAINDRLYKAANQYRLKNSVAM